MKAGISTKFIRNVLFNLLWVVLLLSPCLADAGAYHLNAPVAINTLMMPFNGNTSSGDALIWQVVPQKSETDEFQLAFYRPGTAQPVCSLAVSAQGQISGSASVLNSQVIVANDLFLASGYPVPCDMFPIDRVPADCSTAFQTQALKEVEGVRFAYPLQVACTTVTFDEALQQGWIASQSYDQNDITASLRMISVTHAGTNELISRQLWMENDTWWLYEETLFRKSWRIKEDN